MLHRNQLISPGRTCAGAASTRHVIQRGERGAFAQLQSRLTRSSWCCGTGTCAAQAVGQAQAIACNGCQGLGAPWPDMSDAALLESLDDWLLPFLSGEADLNRIPQIAIRDAMLSRVPHDLQRKVDTLAPTIFDAPSGSRVPIDYDGERPVLSIRLQELFGLARHPAIADGTVPLTLELAVARTQADPDRRRTFRFVWPTFGHARALSQAPSGRGPGHRPHQPGCRACT